GRRPLISETWASAEIVGTVASDATRIVLGVLNESSGTAWYDDIDLSFESKDSIWQPISIMDGDFEGSDPLASWHVGIGRSAASKSIEGWNVTIDRTLPASGRSSMRIGPSMKLLTEELFDQSPAPGEAFDVALGTGLRAKVPIALYSKAGQTIG